MVSGKASGGTGASFGGFDRRAGFAAGACDRKSEDYASYASCDAGAGDSDL